MCSACPRQRLAELLEAVIEGKLLPIEAMKEAELWEDLPWENRDVNMAMHALIHFFRSADLCKKHPEYDESLKHNLRLFVSSLRYNHSPRRSQVSNTAF